MKVKFWPKYLRRFAPKCGAHTNDEAVNMIKWKNVRENVATCKAPNVRQHLRVARQVAMRQHRAFRQA